MTNWTNGPIFWMNQRADFGPLPVLACEPQRGGLDCVRCSKPVRLQGESHIACSVKLHKYVL